MYAKYFVFCTLLVSFFVTGCAENSYNENIANQTATAQAAGHPILIYQVQTKFLDNVAYPGAYTRIGFVNTSSRMLSGIAFEVVPYSEGEPILRNVSHPVLFGGKDDFEPGKRYAVISAKPVWNGPWGRVDCVHLVGLSLQYADGQNERISKNHISSYLSSGIAAQNCTNPSAPGPHN